MEIKKKTVKKGKKQKEKMGAKKENKKENMLLPGFKFVALEFQTITIP